MKEEYKIPTDKELYELINECRIAIEIFEGMLQLNESGREKVMIYMQDLSSIGKYAREKRDF